MLNMIKPFSQGIPYQEPQEVLSVIGQDEKYVYIESNLEIYPGQVFKFNDGYGVSLDQGSQSRVQPRFPLSERVYSIERHSTLPFTNIPKPLTSVNPSELGRVEAECLLKPKYPKGSLGWTLSFQSFDEDSEDDEKPLVQYHDYYNRGICRLRGTGEWQPGIYTLTVTLYDLETRKPIRSKDRIWDLPLPKSVLGLGVGYNKPRISFL